MMSVIETKIGESGPSLAYVRQSDLHRGSRQIFLGDITREPDGKRFVEEHLESIIIHESTHILIYEITRSIPITRMFDNIDNPYDDSNLYPISQSLS